MASPPPMPAGEAPESGQPEDEMKGKGIVANTLFGLLAQVTTASFTLVLTLFLVRALGPADYGIFSLTLSIGAIGLMVADFGLASSASRFIAERAGEREHLRRVVGTTLRLKLIGAAGVGGGLILLAPVMETIFGNGLTWPVRAVGVSLIFETLYLQATTSFGALRRVDLNARTQIFESLTETTASIAIVLLGTGAGGALLGRASGYAVGTVVGMLLLARLSGRPRLTRDAPSRELSRSITGYAKPLFVINGAYTLYVYTDALLIGALLTPTDVAEFTAPLRLIALVGYVGTSIGTAVAPRLAGTDPDVGALVRWLRIVTLLQFLFVVPLLVWAQPIVQLVLGPEYRLAGDVLQALVPYAFLLGVGPLITISVTYIGEAAQRVPIVLAALAINVVLDVILLPRVGVLGATIGTGIATAIYVPAHLRVVKRHFDLDLRPLAISLLRAGLAAAAASALLLALGTRDLEAWRWVVGLAGMPIVYVAVLRLTRELSADEMHSARDAVAGFLRRR